MSEPSNVQIARVVLNDWRDAALRQENRNDSHWMIVAHILNLIESALDGETDELGIGDRAKIRVRRILEAAEQ